MGPKTRKRKLVSQYIRNPPKLIHLKGYKILLVPMNRKITVIQSFINAGFVSEKKTTAGLAHLLEHVLSDAWKKCKGKPCERYWNRQGVTSNASTDLSMLNYWIKGLEKYTPEMLEYIISITCKPVFTNKILDRERKIVRNELMISHNEPLTKLYNDCNQALYSNTGLRYSQDMKQQLANLKTFTQTDLYDFERRHYTPFNIIFVVAGALKKRDIMKLFNRHLPVGQPCPAPLPLTCFTRQQAIIYSRNKEAKNTDILIIFHTKPLENKHDAVYFPIVNDILGGSMSSELIKVLRLKLKLIYGLSLSIETIFCGIVVNLEMATEDKNIKETITVTMKTIQKFLVREVNEALIENIKNKYLVRLHSACYMPGSLSDFYAIQYMNQIYNQKPDIYSPKDVKKAIENLNVKIVKKLLNRLFHFSTCIIGYQGRRKIKLSFSDFS